MFQHRLKEAMDDLGITAAGLSEMTGIGKSSISQYINGRNVPTAERQAHIAKSMGLSVDYFKTEIAKVEMTEDTHVMPRLTPKDAAQLMGVSITTIMFGLRDGVFPWGYAIRGSGNRWIYVINAKRFAAIEMIDIPGVTL